MVYFKIHFWHTPWLKQELKIIQNPSTRIEKIKISKTGAQNSHYVEDKG